MTYNQIFLLKLKNNLQKTTVLIKLLLVTFHPFKKNLKVGSFGLSKYATFISHMQHILMKYFFFSFLRLQNI